MAMVPGRTARGREGKAPPMPGGSRSCQGSSNILAAETPAFRRGEEPRATFVKEKHRGVSRRARVGVARKGLVTEPLGSLPSTMLSTGVPGGPVS